MVVSTFEQNLRPFEVLFVCTGNICRSPIGEQLFAARADEVARERFGFHDSRRFLSFASAGVRASEGDRMTTQAADVSTRYGADPSRHGSRRLTEQQLASAGLILGATRDHRREVVSMHPKASRIAFTIPEFARLFDNLMSDADLVASLRAQWGQPKFAAEVVAAVSSRRGLVRLERASDDDVVDPYRRSQATYDSVGKVLADAAASVRRNVELLLPPVTTTAVTTTRGGA